MEHAGNRHDGAGRILGTLEHDGAARADGGGDLADGLVVGEVPGREGGAHAHRLAHHDRAHVGVARRDHAAVDAAAFLGSPVQVLGAGHDLADGLGQGLALVQRHVAADFLGVGAGQLGYLAQDGRAVHGRGALPGFEGALGRFQGVVQVGMGGVGQLAQDFLGGGIDDVFGLAAVAADEFAVDIEG